MQSWEALMRRAAILATILVLSSAPAFAAPSWLVRKVARGTLGATQMYMEAIDREQQGRVYSRRGRWTASIETDKQGTVVEMTSGRRDRTRIFHFDAAGAIDLIEVKRPGLRHIYRGAALTRYLTRIEGERRVSIYKPYYPEGLDHMAEGMIQRAPAVGRYNGVLLTAKVGDTAAQVHQQYDKEVERSTKAAPQNR
jgi:hypothetical protein